MSTVLAPYGFKPLRHRTGGVMRPSAFKGAISSAYATSIGKGCPVYWAADGTIALLAAGGSSGCDGIFDHCEYTTAAGDRRVSNYWPASTVASDTVAYVWTDPDIVYGVQSAGSIPLTDFGGAGDHVAGTVNTRSGLSADTLVATASIVSATNLAMFKVVGLVNKPGNAWGDTYTEVQVVIAEVGNAFLATKGSSMTAGAAI